MIKPKILIIENDSIVTRDLQSCLSNFGYDDVVFASTCEEAIKKVIATLPDLILMDVRLEAEKDGIETASVLQSQYGAAVVYLIDNIDTDMLKYASKTELYGYLFKPIDKRELRTTIESAFYRKDLERRLLEIEKWYGTTLRSIGEAVISTDTKGSIKFMNTAAENITGWKMVDALGENLQKVFQTKNKPADLSPVYSTNQMLNNETIAILKYQSILISREGKEIPIEESVSPIKDEIGNTIGVVLVFEDVSERKQVKEALKVSQNYTKSIINSSMDMIVAVDNNRIINEFNKAAEITFGYVAKEVLGKHVDVLYDSPDEGKKIYKTTIENGRFVQEVINRRKNGEKFTSLLTSSVLQNAKGEMIGVMGVSRDITEKRRSDEALRESEERYRALVELSPDPIAVFIGGRFVFVNSAAIDIFGAESSDELLGRSIMDMVHPDHRVAIRDQFHQMAIQVKPAPIVEGKFFRIDWTTFEAEVAPIPFSWQGNSAIQVVLRDVTERRKAEQVIRSSEVKYRTLIENVLDGVYQTTPDGEILTANPALARMLGYETETDLLLLNVEKDLYVNSDERRQYLELLIKGVRIKNAEFKLRRKDGQIITVLENARVVRNRLGDILYFEGTITDINEVKLAQEALRMSEERFRMFVEQSAEAIWCFESPEPMPINLSEDRQIKYLMETDCLTECNNTMARMYGFEDAKQILGTKLKDFLDPTNSANIEYLRLFIRSNYRMINAELHDVYKDGRTKYLLNNIIGVVKEGRLFRIWGTQRDITTDKQTAQRLSSNEEKFRTLTETVASAIFIFIEERIFYANPAMEKLSGYSKEELLYMRFVDIIHPDFREIIQESAQNRLNRNKSLIRQELKIITKSGEERWIDITIETTTYDGKPAQFATAMDIAERKISSTVKDIIYRIAQAQDIYRSMDDLLVEIHTLIREVVPAKNIFIALYDKEHDLLSFPYFTDEIVRVYPSRKAGKGLIEYVLRTKKSLLCTKKTSDGLKKRGKIKAKLQSKIWLGVPLIVEKRIIGVLGVQDYTNENCYGKKQQNILESLSLQIAKVIDRKLVLDNMQQDKESYKIFIEENPIGQFIMDVDGIVIDCNKAFIQMLGYDLQKDVLHSHISIFSALKANRNSLLKQLQKTQNLCNHSMKLVNSSGHAIDVTVNFASVHDHTGALLCIKGTLMPGGSKKRKIFKH